MRKNDKSEGEIIVYFFYSVAWCIENFPLRIMMLSENIKIIKGNHHTQISNASMLLLNAFLTLYDASEKKLNT